MGAHFGRVVVAMVTPFRKDGSLDPDEAQRLARHLVDRGTDTVLVAGSTGESPVLSDTETATLVRAVKDAVGADAKVMAGAGTYDTAHSIERAREAEKCGADAILAVTPYYNRPPQDALLNHFRAVADAADLPVMVYDIPSRTATKIATDTLLRAAEHPNIVAVKEAAGDLTAITAFAADKPDDFDIYSGNDDWTLALQALGAVGVVSVIGNVVPDRFQAQFDTFERGDLEEARRIQFSLTPLVQAAFCTTNPIPIKAAMELLGFAVGDPRPPLRPANDDERQQMRLALEAVGAL